jgi:hypothetical protein
MKTTDSKAKGLILKIAALSAAVMLMLPVAAFAQNASVKAYGGPGGSVESTVVSGTDGPSGSENAAAVASSDSSSLPFTGLDVGWMVGGALLLIGAGIAMGRSASRGPQAS